MLNNGYIGRHSIAFKMEEKRSMENEQISNFILMQYHMETPNMKHVKIKGNVTWPPMVYKGEFNEEDHKYDKFAIIGASVDQENVPDDYKIIGVFNGPNAYRLDREVWLMSNKALDLVDGQQFVFSSPGFGVRSKLLSYMNGNSIEEIPLQQYGTYTLESNRMLMYILFIAIIFLGSVLILLTYVWANKDQKLITILYLSGYSPKRLLKILMVSKLLPFVCGSVLLIAFAIIFHAYIYSLWDHTWVYATLLLFIFQFLSILLIHAYAVFKFSVDQGGKKC